MRGRLNGTRIAVIEDDALLLGSIAIFLQVRGSLAETFVSAEEAFDAVMRGGFDLVICGYRLPGEDGLSFLLRVRESTTAGTMLIASRSFKDMPDEASAAWIDGILTKPFTTMELEATLRRVLDGRGTGSKGNIEMT